MNTALAAWATYLMPLSQLVEADDTIYDPVVLSEHPQDLYADWPKT